MLAELGYHPFPREFVAFNLSDIIGFEHFRKFLNDALGLERGSGFPYTIMDDFSAFFPMAYGERKRVLPARRRVNERRIGDVRKLGELEPPRNNGRTYHFEAKEALDILSPFRLPFGLRPSMVILEVLLE